METDNGLSIVRQAGPSDAGDDVIPIAGGGGVTNPQDTVGAQVGFAVLHACLKHPGSSYH